MSEKEQEEFMKQYMDMVKEQMMEMAKNPDLLSQALKPVMEMSQQLVSNSGLGGAMPNAMIPGSPMDIGKIVAEMKDMIDYIRRNHRELVQTHSLEDQIIVYLDEYSKRLRAVVRKLMEKIGDEDKENENKENRRRG